MVSLLMGALYCIIVYRRHLFRLDGIDVVLFSIISFWYLPKVLIAIGLLLADMSKGLKWLLIKATKVSATPAETTVTADNARRSFLQNAGWTAASVPYIIVANGMFRTLYDFQVREEELVISGLPPALDGFILIQLSDIHAGSFPDEKPFQEVVRIVNSLNPNAIAITGDFVNAKPDELRLISKHLPKLQAEYGTFATLGNHDHYNTQSEHRALTEGVRSLGVDLLVNSNRRITIGSESLVIVGTDNTGFNQDFARLDLAMRNVMEDEPTILLAHDPTFWDKFVVGKSTVDVMLAGHTHGGQFGVDLFGFEWSLAKHVYKQWAGMYSTGSQKLYVNRGIGTVGPPMRIGIRPEITVFTLRRPPFDSNLS